jgi:hypothetical protein
MSHHLLLWPASAAALTVLSLMGAQAPPAEAQRYREDQRSAERYRVLELYDRVADSSRVVATIATTSRRFGLGSRVAVDVSYSYPGRRLTTSPEWVLVTMESFTPARGGWAFARPRPLEVRSGGALKLQVPPAEYRKQPVRLFDAGRRESLSFRVPPAEFLTLASESELTLEVGGASIRLKGRRMETLRAIAERLKPVTGAGR